MTTNSINYQRALEERRHNLEMEEQGRQNIALSQKSLAENISLGYANVGLGYSQLSELSTYHEGMIGYNLGQLAEATRSHVANEKETRRHNIATEIKEYISSVWQGISSVAGFY